MDITQAPCERWVSARLRLQGPPSFGWGASPSQVRGGVFVLWTHANSTTQVQLRATFRCTEPPAKLVLEL
ncbi:hypothetical protein PCASD_21874 [Puccinia coronata f. sp. avenae]|uniref:Uncharacterized protein n=1 Tax=Puccinia coronata f. sp. avenae TaxID=200324 RepID=A0A2N5SHU5_9BASI|nr:hypothetical protein PCASD_21874 [Puccinia coronata f. sp. avenae]